MLAFDLLDAAFWNLIIVSETAHQYVPLSLPLFFFFYFPPLSHPALQLPLSSVSKGSWILGAQVQDCRATAQRPWMQKKMRGKPAHIQNYNASISHTDIIPVFYLSPCNSFYILGLCSLAFIQSQPWDTGLYQAHMCALLHLTHISSFVTVTKLARLSWEMCRLWLTVHVWILYFESHTDLSNTDSVKASLSLLSRTETNGELQRGLQLWPDVSALNYLPFYVWSGERLLSHMSPSRCVHFTKKNLKTMFKVCFICTSVRKNNKGTTKWNIHHGCILPRLPERENSETCTPQSDQSLKLHWESFCNNSLILELQHGADVCYRQRKSVKSVPRDANSLKYCFHNCAS